MEGSWQVEARKISPVGNSGGGEEEEPGESEGEIGREHGRRAAHQPRQHHHRSGEAEPW